MDYQTFEARAREIFASVPDQFLGGIDGLEVSRRTELHPSLPEVFTLGECLTEHYPSEFGGAGEGFGGSAGGKARFRERFAGIEGDRADIFGAAGLDGGKERGRIHGERERPGIGTERCECAPHLVVGRGEWGGCTSARESAVTAEASPEAKPAG